MLSATITGYVTASGKTALCPRKEYTLPGFSQKFKKFKMTEDIDKHLKK